MYELWFPSELPIGEKRGGKMKNKKSDWFVNKCGLELSDSPILTSK